MTKKNNIKGRGVVSSVSNLVGNVADKVQNTILSIIPNQSRYTDKVQGMINKYGKFKINNLTVCKNPVDKLVNGLANALSLNEVKKQMSINNIDALYHVFLKVEIFDVNANQIFLVLEKNETINLDIFNNSLITLNTQQYAIPNFVNVSFNLNSFLGNTQSQMGNSNFFNYNAIDNNCGDFVIACLKANNLYNTNIINFLVENITFSKKAKITKHSKSRLHLLTKMGAYVKQLRGGDLDFNNNQIRFI